MIFNYLINIYDASLILRYIFNIYEAQNTIN